MPARYDQITFRVDEFEREAIREAAEANYLKEGNFVRMLVLKGIGYQAPKDLPEDYESPRKTRKKDAEEDPAEEFIEEEGPEGGQEFTVEDPYGEAPKALPTGPCVHCSHPYGAHMDNPEIGPRCVICPPTDESVHKYEEA